MSFYLKDIKSYRFAFAFMKLKEEKFLEGKDGLVSIMPIIILKTYHNNLLIIF